MSRRHFDRTFSVLSIAYPLQPVGPGAGGGSEQILSLLDHELTCVGHRSLVIAAEGSQTKGKLLATPLPSGEITDPVYRQAQSTHKTAIEAAIKEYEVDLIHYHGFDFPTYIYCRKSIRQLATLHLPISWYPASILDNPSMRLVCVSQSQARSDCRSASLPVVENGVDLTAFQPIESKSDFLLWLGRICPEKGVTAALRTAHLLDLPLVIGGPIYPFESHRRYFRDEVAPLLDQKRQYLGPLNLEQKVSLLARARCVLIPSLVPETSSLVAMEAMASGTPVVALRTGALPDVVQSGKTGFVVESEDQMPECVLSCTKIPSQVCRNEAELRFDSKRMTAEYLQLYQGVLSHELK